MDCNCKETFKNVFCLLICDHKLFHRLNYLFWRPASGARIYVAPIYFGQEYIWQVRPQQFGISKKLQLKCFSKECTIQIHYYPIVEKHFYMIIT